MKAISFMFATIFLWSTIEVVSKVLQDDIGPLWIAFLRFFIGGTSLLPLALFEATKRDYRTVPLKDWGKLFLFSIIGISLTFTMFHVGLTWMDASSAATLISTAPLFMVPMSVVMLKERMGVLGIVGTISGTAGIVLILATEGWDVEHPAAPMLIIFAVICFSFYSVAMKPLNARMGYRFTTPISLFIGSLFILPAIFVKGEGFDPLSLGPSEVGWVLYLSVIAVGASYMLYFIGLRMMSVSRGSSFFYLKPIMASFLAWMFLGETTSIFRIAAIVIISISIYLVVMEYAIKEFYRKKVRHEGRSTER